MTIFFRLLRSTIQNIFRNGLMSLVAILVITLLFLLFNGILFANFFQKAALESVNKRIDLALDFTKPIDEFQINSLIADLKKTFPEIRTVNFISSEEAFRRFLVNFGETNHELSDWLKKNSTASPLPSTLVISVDAALHTQVLDFLSVGRFSNLLNLSAPTTGKLATTTTKKIITANRTFSQASLIVAITFGILSTLIIIAVLQLAIFSRKTEIGIMRIVGATRQFVQLPFILEGVFFGITASVLGSTVFFAILSHLNSNIFYGGIDEFIRLATLDYLNNFTILLTWQILAAIVIGTIASTIATQKYLRRNLILD